MNEFSIFDFIFEFFYQIRALWYSFYNFLFYKVDISWATDFIEKIISFFGGDFMFQNDYLQLWEIISGTGIFIILAAVLIKKIIPLLG